MGRARRSAERANSDLKEREKEILSRTSIDRIKDLIPEHTDPETARKLINVINDHTSSNLSVAEFQGKVESLGEGCLEVFSKVIKLL